MAHRVEALREHLARASRAEPALDGSCGGGGASDGRACGIGAAPCIGEMENRQVDAAVERAASGREQAAPPPGQGRGSSDPVFRFRFVRHAVKIVFPDNSAADERYGGSGDVAILEGELLKPSTSSATVHIFMHPSGIQNLLPMPVAMARAGLHVLTCASRYPNNDSCLIMEKVAIDLGACVTHARTELGYAKVVLCGWSGGGSLAAFYQAQAERPSVRQTPAGDPVDLCKAALPAADALMILAAHSSRARIFTEWIDPSVLDERDPSSRDPSLDLFHPNNAPPFSAEFLERYRHAQVARNRRITAWVKKRLQRIEAEAGAEDWRQGKRDEGFTVHCTQADPWRIDLRLGPNGRKPTTLRELAAENHSPVGLARFTTLRSWLSQWSIDDSNADGPSSLACVSVPVLVLANGADHLVPLAHARAMFDAVPHDNKEYLEIEGATHYYFGQRDKLAEAVGKIVAWSRQRDLLETKFTW